MTRARASRAALVALALLLLLAPHASAQALPRVTLERDAGVWNGLVQAPLGENETTVDVWLPPGARVHEVVGVVPGVETPAQEVDATWRAAGAEAIRVRLDEPATYVRVSFDLPPAQLLLPDYVAPRPIPRLELRIAPGEGLVVQSPDAPFALRADGYEATLTGLEAGERVELRVVDAGRVGELGVLTTVVLLGALGVMAGIAWHRARPPAQGRAPERLVEHLEELQARLVPPVVLFGALNVLYFVAGLRVVERRGLDVLAPVLDPQASLSARAFEAFAERLVPPGVQLVVTRPLDAVLAQVETALFLALLTTLPLLLYELAAFLGPALLPHERRLALRTLPLASLLFLAGALFGLLVMAPVMMRTLYAYAPALGAAPLLVVQDLVGFALLILLVFGAAFELPVLMYALARFGLVKSATYRRYWRHAIIAIFLLGGLVTPDPSLVSQALVAVPLALLYAVGLLVARWGERTHARMRATT